VLLENPGTLALRRGTPMFVADRLEHAPQVCRAL
jgi:hypothetical protein